MAYLIDGNNFIGHSRDLILKDQESRARLISRLLAFQKVRNTRVIIVFDGPADSAFTPEAFHDLPFFVRHPDFGQNADMLIKDIISRETDLRRFFVVSSDRDIRDFARAKGARIITCQAFERELKTALKKHRKNREMQKNVATPTPLEIQHWEEMFKAKK